jgi:ribonuclease BN (tRNA processing enzyme)
LGSGTLVAGGERGAAGFLIEHENTRLLIDGGSGTLDRLGRLDVDLFSLDGGVYSHRHLDHCGDLAPLLFHFFCLGPKRARSRDYPLFGGEGLAEFVEGLQSLYGRWTRPEEFAVPVTEVPLDGPGEALLPGGIRLSTRPANHDAGAVHLRFDAPDGSSAVFSGDTGPSEGLIELATGVDLLVCECALPEGDPYPKHLTPSAVAQIVDAARPRQVAMTHFYPEVDVEAALAKVAATGVATVRGYDLQAFDLRPADP